METKKSDPVGSAVQALRKVVRKEAFIADAAAIAPPTNKKIVSVSFLCPFKTDMIFISSVYT